MSAFDITSIHNLSLVSRQNEANFELLYCVGKTPVSGTVSYSVSNLTTTSIIVQQDATINSSLYFCKLLYYMFRVVTPPIIRSTYNCNYSIWHWSNRLCYLPNGR